jgi:hypothetical protein
MFKWRSPIYLTQSPFLDPIVLLCYSDQMATTTYLQSTYKSFPSKMSFQILCIFTATWILVLKQIRKGFRMTESTNEDGNESNLLLCYYL